MERRRKPMKNRLVVFRDSSIESTEGERVVVIDYPLPVRSGDRLPTSCSVHLISIGSRCLMLQVWAEPAYGLLVFRVVVDPGDGRKADLLAQAESREGVLTPSQWHHMALSYRQRNESKRNAHGRLAVWIDGRRNSEVALDFATQLSRKAGLPSDKLKTCFVGHSVASQEDADHFGCSWSLGNLLVFNDAVLDSLSAFHLYSCGPDLRSVLPCKLGMPPPLYTRYADLDILRTGQLQDLLIRGQGLNLSSLRASVCLTYSPGVPATYTTYEYPSPGRGQRRSSSYRQPPIPRDVSLVAGKSVLVSLYPRVHQGLQASLYNVGCIGAFIFLFARVVELCASEVAQACALQSVLSLAKRHQRRWNELTADRGHAMLFQVLGKPRAFVGFHVLKVLLDAACDCSVLSWNPERSCFELYPETHAVIQDVELLGSMLSAWRVWARAQAGVWETLMAAMEILIRETHPAQMFNVKQLLRARLVEQLLLTCLLLQENEHEDPIGLPPAVSRAFVRLVEELMGSPPDSELLASVCSFLLAAHSPASTYVCHTSAAFYFSLHTDGRIVEEKLCAINALRKQSSPQATAPHTPDSSCSFAFESPKVPLFSSSSNAAEMTKGKSPKGSPPSPEQPTSDIPKLRRQMAVRHHDTSLDDLRELPEVEAECGNLPVVGYDDSRQGHQSSDDNSASSQTLCDEVDITIDCHSTTGVKEPCGPVDLKHLVSDGDETGDKPTTTSHNADESKVDDVFQGFIRKDHQTFDTGALDGAWGEHGLIGGQSSFESADTISSRSESWHRSLEDGDTQSSSRLEAGTGCARMLQRVLSRNWDLGLAFPSVSHGTLNCPKSPLERSSDEEWTTGFFPGSSVDSDTTMATEPLCNSPTEDGLLLIFCGLYRLLHTMLLLLPDSMLPAFTDGLLTPEMLIVLCNHPSPDARLSVVKVLDAHFQRATDEQKTAFVRGHGFYLLANQLHQHVASRSLVETFLSLLRGQSLALDGEQEFESVKDIPSFQRRWVVPLLALVVPSLHDTLLAHDLLFTLLRLFGACTRLADILLDSGLLSVLCNAATVLSAMDISTLPRSDGGLLLGDIQQFLLAATLHACTSAGSHYFRLLDDLLAMLGHFQTSQHARTQALAAALQFKVLHASINFIHSVVTARGRGITSSFSLPSKPHHALQQKRRSIAGTLPMWDSIIPRQPRQHLPSHASPVTPTSLQLGSSSAPFARAGFAVPTSPGGRHLASGQDNVLIAQLRSAASEEFTRLVQRRLSHDGVVCAREAELTQRLQRVSVMAVNRLLFHDTSYDAVDIGDLPAAPVFVWPQTREQPSDDAVHETTSPRVLLQEGVFHLMVEGLKTAVEGARGLAPCQQWCRLLSSCRETFRVQFARLLLHILSPLRPFSERLLGLSLLLEPSCKEILREVLTTPLQPGPKLAVSAFELLWEKSGQLSRQEQKSVELLLTLLKQAGTKIPGSCPAWPETLETLHMEVENWNKEEAVNRESWWRRMVTTQQELLGRIEARGRIISRAAAQVTQRVASRQGLERKRVMEHLREACKADLGTQHSWQALFCQLTHERAVWFDPVACPMSWQLDPTEGPSRERRRLQRCRLHVPNKYLLKDRRQSDDISQPLLSYLFEDKSHFSGASAVKDRATSEPTKFTHHCISIVPSRETPGELLLGEKGMYFVEDNAGDSAEGLGCTGDAEPLSFSWAYEDIKEVHLRWFQLRDNALEIFLINGHTLLLTFESTKVRDQVHQSVLATELPNLLEYRNLHALTQLWSSGQITNFEYLTHLNKHAGRSFNDLMQYPVMPFVLSDYTSEMLNLTDLQVYRNLAKPIAVQSKEKEDRYVHNYKWLEEEFQKGGREDDPMPPVQPYHYGSHYSNSGTTLHFLVRLPPFTKMFLAYQDQSFDIPDRTFHSMYTTWRLSSYESSTDVKELIPEFFYMPEFLLNREGFDFGIRQNGSPVHHVSLPPWARSDPRLFVLIHRQALESDHMSLTLCHWIDLVFGHKQKGRAAVQAINVFHPATYFGMDVSAVEDPVQQRALETMIRTYGQTPRQLFTVPHPSRCPARSPSEMETTSAMGIFVQFAFRESHEVARDITVPSPLPWIRGLKWGEYVGSLSCPDPVVCFSQAHPGQSFGCLLPLPTRAICGLAQNFCLLMTYSKEQGVRTMHSTDIQWSAILSWGYVDNSLRLKSKQTGPALSLVQCDAADEVCCCAWTPDSRQLYTGNRAGVLTVYGTHFSSSVPLELELERKVCFYGHKGGIAALHVCKPFSILVSASQDGTCILWDLNRLCYVQSLTDHKSPVNAISVSDTTGDIASACHSVGGGSDLRLWTVNGDLIGHMHSPEAVCSLAFSNQPEGVSVNVIAGGLENGVVRLWSTWDLKAIREIMYPKCSLSITSLTFSVDGLYLFTADEEGKVMSWCRRDHIRNKPPLFYSFLSGFAE